MDEKKFEERQEQRLDERQEQRQRNDDLSTATLAGAGKGSILRENEPAASAEHEQSEPLLAANEAQQMRGRWDAIQAAFVDQPQEAVAEADKLVAAAMKRLAEMFADERAKLEGQWHRGENVSTEDLRQALRRYRTFFNRLLSI